MRVILALTIPCLVGAAATPRAAAAPAQRPNIVVILADDLGYGDVQALNPQRGKIPTPRIDELAAQGMVFTEAHSGSSVCTPTRYGLLTGRYAWRTRLQSGVLDDYVEPLIAADRLTVPGLLRQQGYHTACIGKWHLGFTIAGAEEGAKRKRQGAGGSRDGAPLGSVTNDGPLTRGFDEFYGFHHARMMKSVFENDRVTQRIEPVEMLPALAQRAAQYIAERATSEQPFFLYLPLSSPHTPIVPGPEWEGRSGLNKYADFVMQTDWVVGEVLAALDRAGVTKNTLVLFTSDNGCSPAAKVDELERLGHFASELRRGYKADLWDGGHRVPFIVRWPGQVEAGSRSEQLVCLTDLLATCAALLDVSLPVEAGEDSISFLLTLLNTAGGAPRETVVHHSIRGNFAIRDARWKLELCADSGGWSKGGAVETAGQLYDMSQDVGERVNEYAAHPEIVTRLTALLEQSVADGRSTPGPVQQNDVAIDLWKRNARAVPME